MTPFTIFLMFLCVLAIIFAVRGIQRVPEGRVRLVERFGRYHRTLNPGINFIIPGLDTIKKGFPLYTYINDGEQYTLIFPGGDITTQEQILDPKETSTIAADNAVVYPDTIAYFRIIEPEKAVYGVGNLGEAMIKLLETTLRQEVGLMDSDTLIRSRDVVGAKCQEALERASEAWGVKILRVEIQEIRFSPEVQKRLTEAREAELLRRAEVVKAKEERDVAIHKAEGVRQANILEAEGIKKAKILEAEGKFEAARLEAEGKFLLESKELEGRAKGTRALGEALRERPEALVAFEALKAQAEVAKALGKSSNAMIIPADVAGLFGAMGAIKKGLSVFSSGKKQSDSKSTDKIQ